MRTLLIVLSVLAVALVVFLLLRKRALTLRPAAPTPKKISQVAATTPGTPEAEYLPPRTQVATPGVPTGGTPTVAPQASRTVAPPVPRTVNTQPGPEFYIAEYSGLLNSIRTNSAQVRNRTLGRPSIGLSVAVNQANAYFDNSSFPAFQDYMRKRGRFDLPWGRSVTEGQVLDLMHANHVWRYRVEDPTIGKSRVVEVPRSSMLNYARQALANARNIAGVTA